MSRLPLALHRRYKDKDETGIREFIEQTLNFPGKEPDTEWKLWLVIFSFAHVRPRIGDGNPVKPALLRNWVAFALRYLQPLLTGSPVKNRHEDIADEFNALSDRMLAVLLVGTVDDFRKALQGIFRDIPISDVLINKIRILEKEGRQTNTIGGWSRKPIQALKDQVILELHPVSQEMIAFVTNRDDEESSNPFDYYVRLASMPDYREFYTLAVAYQCECTRRKAMIDTQFKPLYITTPASGGVILGIPSWIISRRVKLPIVVWFGFAVLLSGTLSQWISFGTYLLDSVRWRSSALATLDLLKAEIDNQLFGGVTPM